MGLTRSQLHQVKETFDLVSFSKKWWKSLSKEIKKTDISQFQKIQVFIKIMEGLLIESMSLVGNPEDYQFVCDSYHDFYSIIQGDSHE